MPDRSVPLGRGQRVLALGGVAGAGGFVAAWAIRGSTRAGYSGLDDAISQLAASGAPGRHWMTAGFVAFGIGVPLYAMPLRRSLPGPAWMTAVATGVCTLAVAAAPLGIADTAHYVAATAGYVTLVATPLLAARAFAARGRRGWARWSLAAGIGSAVMLIASTADPLHGFSQRLGLGITDAWIIATALTMGHTGCLGHGPESHHPTPSRQQVSQVAGVLRRQRSRR